MLEQLAGREVYHEPIQVKSTISIKVDELRAHDLTTVVRTLKWVDCRRGK
jgi:hypothetical protein